MELKSQTIALMQNKLKQKSFGGKNKNRSMTNKLNDPNGHNPFMVDNVIEERCNSEESKSRITSTHRSVNIHGDPQN